MARTTTRGTLIGLAGLLLFAACSPGPASAQNACPADLGKTCPVDYAAKTCQDPRPSLEVAPVGNLVSLEEEPKNVAEKKLELTNYECTGAYDRDVAVVLGLALDYVQKYRAPGPGEKQLALVLDIDETALSNWPAILTDDYGFIRKGPCDLSIEGACGFEAWQLHAKDAAIVPTLKLFNLARSKGITVFFITGRCEIPHMREATIANLRAAGYVDWDDKIGLKIRPAECPHLSTVALFKDAQRAEIEADGYKIIANVGDQISDLAGDHPAEKNFKVPDPFYFIK